MCLPVSYSTYLSAGPQRTPLVRTIICRSPTNTPRTHSNPLCNNRNGRRSQTLSYYTGVASSLYRVADQYYSQLQRVSHSSNSKCSYGSTSSAIYVQCRFSSLRPNSVGSVISGLHAAEPRNTVSSSGELSVWVISFPCILGVLIET